MDIVFNLEEVENAVEKQEASFGLLETGVYKNATVVRGVLGKTKKGNNKIDLTVKTAEGHEQTIYQAFVIDTKWASGAENKWGYEAWLRFARVCGVKSLDTFQEKITKNDGTPAKTKDGQDLVLTSVKDLKDKVVDIAIQKVFGYYNGQTTEKNEVYDAYAVGSAKSDKVAKRLKDKEDSDYKAFLKAGGCAIPAAPEADEEEEDLI